MAIRSQEVTQTRYTLVMDDGRTFTLTRPAMKALIDTRAADAKAASNDVLTQMRTILGPEQFDPKAFLLDVSAAGSFLNVGMSADSKEVFA